MDYKSKYFKYKRKYLIQKNLQGGVKEGVKERVILPYNLKNEIYSYFDFDCKDFISNITKLANKEMLANFDWNLLPVPIKVDSEVNLMIRCSFCDIIQNEFDRNKCTQYYNMCKLLNIYNKYIQGGYNNELINKNVLHEILYKTILVENSTFDTNTIRNDQNYLLELGASPIVNIEDFAFANYESNRSLNYDQFIGIKNNLLTIPDTVETIGNYSFSNNLLTTLIIPDTITSIGDGSFQRNKIFSLVLPDSLTNIPKFAFAFNKITSLTIPNSITSIDSSAFSSNNLKSIQIPNSVINIGDGAFSYNQLNKVVIPRRFQPYLKNIFGYGPTSNISFTFT